MKFLILCSLFLILASSCGNQKSKIRKEILSKANTEMEKIVDNAINSQTAGFGSLLIDNLMTPEKKQKMIDDNLLPRFRDFVNNTNDKDSLVKMNTDEIFRYQMILKSTIGNASEEALKALYEKIISGDFNLNIK